MKRNYTIFYKWFNYLIIYYSTKITLITHFNNRVYPVIDDIKNEVIDIGINTNSQSQLDNTKNVFLNRCTRCIKIGSIIALVLSIGIVIGAVVSLI